jgi:hypothetical protein
MWEYVLHPRTSPQGSAWLLNAPADNNLKGIRERAILATLLYHGIRREDSAVGV